MKVLITGGTGFVGTALCRDLHERGHTVTTIGRRPDGAFHPTGADHIRADTRQPGLWQKAVTEADAVVNLAGATIFKRWTNAYKEEMVESRVATTRNVVTAMTPDRPTVLLSASAVGIYGDGGEEPITETSPVGTDYLARMAIDWEAAACEAAHARVALLRLGVVLGTNGGAMEKMLPAFKAGLGGPVGSGRQWFPWIHIDDLVDAIRFLMDTPTLSGPFNLAAPGPVRQIELARALGRLLHRPAIVPAPGWALRLAMGEVAGTMLASQRMVPERLMQAGFAFTYSDIDSALAAIVSADIAPKPAD